MHSSAQAATSAQPCRLQELAFALVQGSLAGAPWQVMQERRLEANGRRITLQIVGSSHVVHIEDRRLTLAEVLVQRRHLPPGLAVLASCSLGDGTSRQVVNAPGYAYRTVGRVEYQSPAELRTRLAAFRAADDNTLLHLFPSPAGDAATALRYNCSDTGLQLLTVHTYPEAGAWVETESSWDWKS